MGNEKLIHSLRLIKKSILLGGGGGVKDTAWMHSEDGHVRDTTICEEIDGLLSQMGVCQESLENDYESETPGYLLPLKTFFTIENGQVTSYQATERAKNHTMPSFDTRLEAVNFLQSLGLSEIGGN